MIHLDHPQGSQAWIDARLGIPTASSFDMLITPGGKPSKSAERLLDRCVAEWLIGASLDEDVTNFMQRGHDLEAEAVRAYEFLTDNEAQTCGICLTDDRRIGASPDRFVGDAGLLELKCPAPHTHVGYIRTLREAKPAKYWPQIQGQLMVTGRAWVDFMSYHPTIRPVIKRFERDEPYIETLRGLATAFCDVLDQERAEFLAAGYAPALEAA